MNTDANTLLSQAKCYLCLGISMAEALQLALLADIASGGGGSGSAQVYSTTDSDPNAAGIIPADTSAGAIFFQDPSITLFNEWKWSVVQQKWYQTIAP